MKQILKSQNFSGYKKPPVFVQVQWKHTHKIVFFHSRLILAFAWNPLNWHGYFLQDTWVPLVTCSFLLETTESFGCPVLHCTVGNCLYSYALSYLYSCPDFSMPFKAPGCYYNPLTMRATVCFNVSWKCLTFFKIYFLLILRLSRYSVKLFILIIISCFSSPDPELNNFKLLYLSTCSKDFPYSHGLL